MISVQMAVNSVKRTCLNFYREISKYITFIKIEEKNLKNKKKTFILSALQTPNIFQEMAMKLLGYANMNQRMKLQEATAWLKSMDNLIPDRFLTSNSTPEIGYPKASMSSLT